METERAVDHSGALAGPPAAADGDDASGAELVARLRAGDADAFADVVRSWSPGMLRVARAHVTTDATAQEVVQETWLAVITGLRGFEGRSRLRTWVYSILLNLARRRGVRDRRLVPLSALEGGGGAPLIDPGRFRGPEDFWAGIWLEGGARPQDWGPEAEVLTTEVRALLVESIATLPGRQRDVLVMRDVHELSTEETADALDLTSGNVRVLLHRARVRLRGLLEEYHRGTGEPG